MCAERRALPVEPEQNAFYTGRAVNIVWDVEGTRKGFVSKACTCPARSFPPAQALHCIAMVVLLHLPSRNLPITLCAWSNHLLHASCLPAAAIKTCRGPAWQWHGRGGGDWQWSSCADPCICELHGRRPCPCRHRWAHAHHHARRRCLCRPLLRRRCRPLRPLARPRLPPAAAALHATACCRRDRGLQRSSSIRVNGHTGAQLPKHPCAPPAGCARDVRQVTQQSQQHAGEIRGCQHPPMICWAPCWAAVSAASASAWLPTCDQSLATIGWHDGP